MKITSEKVGKIVNLPAGYPAFMPHKLCPNGFDFSIDTDCIKLLSEADRALGELKGITETLPNPELFVAFYVRKEALLSSQIEGTQCSLDEVFQANEKTSEIKPVSEVINYIGAMNLGLEQLSSLPLSTRLIHTIHSKLLHGVRGKDKNPGAYKRNQNWIGPPGSKISEAVYVPPPPEVIHDYMDDLVRFYHDETDLPPLIKVGLFHSQFETIHPYTDGNGRLGRLLITFMLCESNVLTKPLLYLSLFFKENKPDYYSLLMDVRYKGAWAEWVKFFLRGVRNTSQEAIETANEIKLLLDKDQSILKERFSQYKLTFPCFDLICKNPIITIAQAAERLKTSYASVAHRFSNFLDVEILRPYDTEKKRNKRYYYSKYLEILKRGT